MMRILRVRLKNIKSYDDGPVIDFHPGVNFISGKNGSGKTTLLEAIGLAIFDFMPYSSPSQMLRNNTSEGKIIVWFCFEDGIEYMSIRNISRSHCSWVIRETADSTEIVSGVQQSKKWIQERMGVPLEMDISSMYSDIIGVPQGEITTWFKISSPRERMDHFNGILGVEEYREAFKQTSSLPNGILSRIDKVDGDMREIRGRTESYPAKKDEEKEVKKQISELEKEVAEKEGKLRDKEAGVKGFDQLKTRIDGLNKEKDVTEENIRNLEETCGDLKKEISTAKESKKKVTQSKVGHDNYVLTKEKIEKIEKKRTKKAELEKTKNELIASIGEFRESIKGKQNNLDKQKARVLLELTTEKNNLRINSIPFNKNLGILTQIAKRKAFLDKANEYFESLLGVYDSLKAADTNNQNRKRDIQRREKLIHKLRTELKSGPDLDEVETREKKLKDKIRALQTRLGAILDKISTYQQSIERGTVCPILNEPCSRIKPDIIERKISDLEDKERDIKNELTGLEHENRLLDEEKNAAASLNAKQGQIDDENEEISRLKNEIKTETSRISGIPKQTIDIVKGIEISLKSAKYSIQIKKRSQSEELFSFIERIKPSIKDGIKEAEGRLKDEQIMKEKENSSLNTKIKESNRLIIKHNNEIREQGKEQLIINEKRDELKTMESEFKEVSTQLKPFENVETDLLSLRGVLKENESAHKEYSENIQLAESLRIKIPRLSSKTTALKTSRKKLSSVLSDLKVLLNRYDEKTHNTFIEEAKALREEKTSAKTNYDSARKKLDTLISEIRAMEAEIKKIAPMEEEKSKLERAWELLKIIRNILNAVGKPIAQRYLNTISASANSIYNSLSDERTVLSWEDDFKIRIKSINGVREFRQLSGGEQMSAALSVQLALAKEFSNIGLAFFDEPTTNLDELRRQSLADAISKIKEDYGFNQLFIISHDETFSSLTEQEIHLEKKEDKTSIST